MLESIQGAAVNIETKLHELRQAGAERARARAYHSTMDRLRKQVKASIMHSAICDGMSIGKSEAWSLTHTDYITQCEAAEAAEYDALLADSTYAACQAEVEVWRSLQATARAEMNLS